MAVRAVAMVTNINNPLTGNTFEVDVLYSGIDTALAQGPLTTVVSTASTPAQIRQQIANQVRDKLISDYGYTFPPTGDSIVLLGLEFNNVAV